MYEWTNKWSFMPSLCTYIHEIQSGDEMPAPTSQARPGPPPVTYEKRWFNIFDIASNQVLAQKWHKCALSLKGGGGG